jgi:hypothetical protein
MVSLLALPATADPTTPEPSQKTLAPTAQEAPPTPPALSKHASSEKRPGAAQCGTSGVSAPHHGPLLPTRRSVRAQIESVDPAAWLSRYGPVERRDLR